MPELTDRHVSVLEYQVTFGPDQVIESDLTETYETDLFEGTFTHDGKRLRCELREHFASVEEAREAVERTLRAWTILLGLKDGPSSSIEFAFIGASFEDRNTDKPGHGLVIQPASMNVRLRSESVQLSPHRERYPGPPEDLEATDLVWDLWKRFVDYHEGQERRQAFAFFVLDSLTKKFGTRNKLRRALALEKKVLSRVGEFSSERGDRRSARKIPKDRKFRPLSSEEARWLDTVVQKMILRLGKYEAGAALKTLTLDDLPDISGS